MPFLFFFYIHADYIKDRINFITSCLFFILSQTAFLGKGTSSRSAVPAKPTKFPDSQPSEAAGDTTAMHLLHLHAAPRQLSELLKYFPGNRLFGTSHPAGASLGFSGAWLMAMYAPRKYATVFNEPCVASRWGEQPALDPFDVLLLIHRRC